MSETTGWTRVNGELRKVCDGTLYTITKHGPECWTASTEGFVVIQPTLYDAKRAAHRHAEEHGNG